MSRPRLPAALLALAALIAACAAPPPTSGAATPPFADPYRSVPVAQSRTPLSRTGVIRTLVAILAANGDASLEAVFAALETAPRPGNAPPSPETARIGVYVQSCQRERGPVIERVQARVCATQGGSLRALYHSDLRTDAGTGEWRLDDIRAALTGQGYSASEAIQWPVPAHMPHPYVQTVFLPARAGPAVIVDYERGSGVVRDIALFWAEAE